MIKITLKEMLDEISDTEKELYSLSRDLTLEEIKNNPFDILSNLQRVGAVRAGLEELLEVGKKG